MKLLKPGRSSSAAAVVSLWSVLALAQPDAPSSRPLRTAPAETLTVNPGFRDWGPTTIVGTTILGGNMTNRGGLFAVDTLSGKVKWTYRPTTGGTSVSTAPAVSDDAAIVSLGYAVVAVSVATGKLLWRGPETKLGAVVATAAGLAYVKSEDGNFYALEAATGRERWKLPSARRGSCESVPVVRDGTVFVNGVVLVRPADANRSAEYTGHLFALDANTGQERWRYPAGPKTGSNNVCLEQPIVTADTYFAVGSQTLYALNLADGSERWKPVEVRRPVGDRVRSVPVGGLVDAGPVLVGLTPVALIAFDKATGQTAWEIPGQYRETRASTAVAGRVLYFQGHPGATPMSTAGSGGTTYVGGKPVVEAAPLPGGRLNALDLDTRAILWSFSRPTAEPNWPFGFVTPIDGGLWVDSYQALVKLK